MSQDGSLAFRLRGWWTMPVYREGRDGRGTRMSGAQGQTHRSSEGSPGLNCTCGMVGRKKNLDPQKCMDENSTSLFPQHALAPLQPQLKQVLRFDSHSHSRVHLRDLLKHTGQLRRSQEGLENVHFYQVSGGRGSHWSGDPSSDHCSSRNLGPRRTKPQSSLHTY